MYLSGILKDKTINFYKESMTSFDGEGFIKESLYFGFDGSITPVPFYEEAVSLEKKLERRQEELIATGIQKTYKLTKNKRLSINELTHSLIHSEIIALKTASRNYAYALFECLYKIILNAKTTIELQQKVEDFHYLRKYLDSFTIPLNQTDLDIILELFFNGKSYTKDDVLKRKSEKFHTGDISNLSKEAQDIISLGEFIAPRRVPIIAQNLQDENELSRYIAPIYFALKDDKQATNFLNLCRQPDLDFMSIEKNARLIRVPDNLINMVRR